MTQFHELTSYERISIVTGEKITKKANTNKAIIHFEANLSKECKSEQVTVTIIILFHFQALFYN